MPEGDSIFRAAARIRAACAGRVVVRAETRAPGPSFGRLVGDTLTTVDTKGKHLFLRFSSGLAVHVHLRMHGSARVVVHEKKDATFSSFRALVGFDDRSIVIREAPTVRLVTAREVERIGKMLGDDLLGASFDEGAFAEKLRASTLPLGEALLDQRLVAGVGNILKSESLFLAKTSPFRSGASLDEGALREVVQKVRATIERSVAKEGGASRFDDAVPFVANRRLTRDRRDAYFGTKNRAVTWVYLRLGEPCFVCRTPIERAYQGTPPRSTYYCARCQGVAPGDAPRTRPTARAAPARKPNS